MKNEMREQKLFGAINNLRKKSPHIFSVMEHCVIVEGNIPTAGVYWDKKAKKFKIIIGDNFFDNLDEDNLSAVLEHEILHCLFEHLSADLKDKQMANIAFDAVINDCIDLFKNDKASELLAGRVRLAEINQLTGSDFNINENTSHEIYDWLMKQKPPKGKGGGQGDKSGQGDGNGGQGDSNGSQYGETIDDHSGFGEERDEIDNEVIKETLKGVIKDNESKFRGIGSMDMDRIVKEAMKSDYDFRKVFRYAVAKNLKDDRKGTWKKSNRRFGLDAKGFKKKEKPNVLLLVDTSGSITEEILAMVDYQVKYLAKFYSFTVAWGDTSLKGSQKIKKGDKVNINYKGGGGTDLNFYKKLTDKERFDLIVFDTDGYIEPIDAECKLKKIFCIFPHGRHVDGYKNIDISMEKL